MYINVSFVDLSNSIYVSRRLWERNTKLESVLDMTAENWSADKIFIGGRAVTTEDLGRCLSEFGGYDIQIERRK